MEGPKNKKRIFFSMLRDALKMELEHKSHFNEIIVIVPRREFHLFFPRFILKVMGRTDTRRMDDTKERLVWKEGDNIKIQD